MKTGPIPLLAYSMIQHGSSLSEELLCSVHEAFQLTGPDKTHPVIEPKRDVNTDHFSGTDIECLEEAAQNSAGNVHRQDCGNACKDVAWMQGSLYEEIDFASFIDANLPNRDALLEYIAETAI